MRHWANPTRGLAAALGVCKGFWAISFRVEKGGEEPGATELV